MNILDQRYKPTRYQETVTEIYFIEIYLFINFKKSKELPRLNRTYDPVYNLPF